MDTERFHVHVNDGEGIKVICIRFLRQRHIYRYVREDMDCGLNMMEACSLPICAGGGATGDVPL